MDRSELKVLLIDDDEDAYILTRECIADINITNYNLDWISDYNSALTAMIGNTHDVYLVDYRLREHNGLTLLKEAMDGGCERPVVFLTGQGDMMLDSRVMEYGAADYLPKTEMTVPLLERTLRHAIERTELQEQLRYQALHDELTGMYNRRNLMERLSVAISSARRHETPLCLCLADLDFFKGINDTHGHNTGDEVIAAFSDIIKKGIRNEDIAGRYGGDEFCVVFPMVDGDNAKICVDRIRETVSKKAIKLKDGTEFNFTATFGIAQLDNHEGCKDLIAAADRALYAAKKKGRNRVEILADIDSE